MVLCEAGAEEEEGWGAGAGEGDERDRSGVGGTAEAGDGWRGEDGRAGGDAAGRVERGGESGGA